jgi:hypothetical protein
MKITNVMTMVESILRAQPETRDCDAKLVSMYFYRELQVMGADLDKLSARGLLKVIWDGKLPSSDAITRARRKLQETDATLRGKAYEKRHGKISEVKKDLGYGYKNEN